MELQLASHPPWVETFLDRVAPTVERIVNSPYFAEMAAGSLSMARFRHGLLNFYPLIEDFPAYMGRVIQKVPGGHEPRNEMARNWLMHNINTERKHTLWYRQWAIDFGVPEAAFDSRIVPPPEVDAINNYLWRVVDQGSLAECIAAVNFAVEGPSGEWTKRVKPNIRAYAGRDGVRFTKRTLMWINAHARYDDKHTPEALEIIKAFATTGPEQERVMLAAQRTMEYYAMAADACYHMAA